jgi:pantoate--beta-alanine ligase
VIVHTIADTRRLVASARASGTSIGFVPTMGALHAGHASLIERARAECGFVAVSIFVNPLQFDRQDDLERYPRTLDTDAALCGSLGVDIVFAPNAQEMYPTPQEFTVDVGSLADHLCGRFRPGHFRGVATVVLKLLNIVQCDTAYFGEKDAQQLAIIRRMTSDLNVPVRIVGVPTVREADGLAMSSRNRHLSPVERQQAPALYRALLEARRLIDAGVRDAAQIVRDAARLVPEAPGVRLEYLQVVDPGTLQPVDRVTGDVLIAGALWVGTTRLIDNAHHHLPAL